MKLLRGFLGLCRENARKLTVRVIEGIFTNLPKKHPRDNAKGIR